MNKKDKVYFTVIIKDTKSIVAIDAIKKQECADWECFILNNTIDNISEYIANDDRFHVIKKTTDNMDIDVNWAIQHSCGKYIIIINSDDILIANALKNFLKMTQLTDTNIIAFKCDYIPDLPKIMATDVNALFRWLIMKNKFMRHVFAPLSCFVFKKEFLQQYYLNTPEHLSLFNMLKNTDAIVNSEQIYLLRMTSKINNHGNDYTSILENYIENHSVLTDDFWKSYFANIIPNMIHHCIYSHDKNTFISFCKNVPLKFVPKKYKVIFGLFKITTKKHG